MRNNGKNKHQSGNNKESKYSTDSHHEPRNGEPSKSHTIPRSCNAMVKSHTQSNLLSAESNHYRTYEVGSPQSTDKSTTNNHFKTFEVDSPNSMEFDRLVRLLHPKFLLESLEKILAFLNSRNKEICFPDINPVKEAFLVRLAADKSNYYSKPLKESCGSVCSKILKVLDVNRNSFKLIHSYESGIVRKRVLVYQKANVQSNQASPEDNIFKVPQSDVKWSTNEGSTSTQQLSSQQVEYKEMFDSLSLPFVMSSLQEILDYVQDDGCLFLNLEAKTAAEAKFFKTLPTFLHKEHLYSLTDRECVPLLAQLRREWSSVRPTVRCMSSKRDSHSVCSIQLSKSPSGKGGPGRRSTRRSKRGGSRRRHRATQNNNSGGDVDKLDASSDSEHSDDSPRAGGLGGGARREPTRRNGQRNLQSKSNGIQWQPAGLVDLSAASEPSEVSGTSDKGRFPPRNTRLREALSVPVEPDKAMRMMRLMGWSGGALGSRGDGITEPIMPAIDTVSGAGLGHTTQHSTRGKLRERHRDARKCSSTRSPGLFRRELLTNVLDFLRNQDLIKKEIALSEPMDVKGRRFLRACFQALNARKNVGLNSDQEKELICRIRSSFNCKPNLGLDFTVSDDLRTYTLHKVEGRVITSKRKRKKFEPMADTVNNRQELSNSRQELSNSRQELSNSCQNDMETVTAVDIDNLIDRLSTTSKRASIKSLSSLAYRVTLMRIINRFILSKCEEKTVRFVNSLLNKRQVTYMMNLIQSINARINARYSSRVENELYQDIRGNLSRNLALQVEFSVNNRSFTLRRLEYKKRFVNTNNPSGARNNEQNAQRGDNENNELDAHNDGKDEEIDASGNFDVEMFNEKGDVNYDTENTVVLSDSDDSVISLECDDDLLADTDYDDDDIIDEIDGRTSGEVTKEGDNDVMITDDVNEIAVAGDTVSLVDNDDKSGDSVGLVETADVTSRANGEDMFEITDVISIANRNLMTDCCENSVDMSAGVETISINEIDLETDENLFKMAVDTDVKGVAAPIDIDSEETIKISEIKSIANSITEVECGNIDKNTDVDTFESQAIENRLDIKEKEDFTEDSSPASIKRSRTDSENSDSQAKKLKLNTEEQSYVTIIPNNPEKAIDREIAGVLQGEIVKNIGKTNELPYLECNGIIDGSLHYKCFDEKSLHWLQDLIQNFILNDTTFIIIPSSEEVVRKRMDKYKMAAKTRSFLRDSSKDALERIKMYNPSLNVSDWVVLEEGFFDDEFKFVVEMDYDSYRCIVDANYSVFAGIDKVEFSRSF